MSRRRATKKNNAEFLMELTARPSWWVGVLPLICLAGAAVSAWRRRERRQLVAEVAEAPANRGASVVDGLSWPQFEKLVGEGFRRQGYRVIETGGGAAGDIVVTSGQYTADAMAFAEGRNIQLVDGKGLQALIRPARSVPSR